MEALLLYGASEQSAALRHEVILPIIDPLLFVEVGGRRAVLSSRLEPAPQDAEPIAAQEELVRAALEEARAGARPGVTGRELHDRTCERFTRICCW